MSSLAQAAAHEAITLCRCWRIERLDGLIVALTDHDEPLLVAGELYRPVAGIDPVVAESSLGLSVEDAELSGVLRSDVLDVSDLERGLYDDAEVRLLIVDWSEPVSFERLATYVMGEVTRTDGAFRAELRGLAQKLERNTGRRFARMCDAELGDARCGVDLGAPGRGAPCEVVEVEGRSVLVSPKAPLDPDQLSHGRLLWKDVTGADGVSRIVAARIEGERLRLDLWEPPKVDPEAGAAAVLQVGCDKTLATCAARFSNAENHRGFPHLPGNDFAFSYAGAEDAHDGRPLVP